MVEHIAENIYRIGVTLPNNPLKELFSPLCTATTPALRRS